MQTQFDLERFLSAQQDSYEQAKRELVAGHKRSHWMWYIFPQIRGLGMSYKANYYGLESLEEARQYLAHPILGARLRELCEVLLSLDDCQANAGAVFGEVDALKLRSSLTLFDLVEGQSCFARVLERYFDGGRDPLTIQLVG